MKRFFKALCAVSLAASVFIFSVVIYGSAVLPDSLELSLQDSLDLGELYSADTADSVKVSSFTNADSYKSRLTALGLVPVKEVTVNVAKRRYVGLGGDIFGIKLYTKGVIAVNIDSVATPSGNVSPCENADIRKGDNITHIDGKEISSAEELIKTVENSDGKALELSVNRKGEALTITLKPVKAKDGKYRAGLWVRDSSAGIGTVTFYDDENGYFAGLGHGVCDVDTGEIMPLSNGEAVRATVNGFYKSSAGDPGELCGVFSDVSLGSLRVNGATGVFGTLEKTQNARIIPVALAAEVQEGEAQIVATVDGDGPQYYDARITKIYDNSSGERNLIVKITDKELLAKTGGILQGMSGSPIIQNSMLVGAVTHVFINDPAQGYGIFAENMIETEEELLTRKAS